MGSWVYTINMWSLVMKVDDEQNKVESKRPRDQFRGLGDGAADVSSGGQAVPV